MLDIPSQYMHYCLILLCEQSSQVDLLAKSEIFDGIDVVCDAACVTPLKRSEGMLPEEILKKWK